MSLPVLIIVRFYCSPRLLIACRGGMVDGDGEGSHRQCQYQRSHRRPYLVYLGTIRLLSWQRVIGISWRIPSHRSPFHAQSDMLMTGAACPRCSLPLPLDGPRTAFVVHFLHYYVAPSSLSLSRSLHALLLLFSSLINFSLVFGSHKFPTLFFPLTLASAVKECEEVGGGG